MEGRWPGRRGRGRASRRWAVVAAAGLLGVTACGSPSPEPAAPTVPPSTPSPSPPPVVRPVPTPSPTVSVDSYAPSGWVNLSTVDPTILVEIRYHGRHNLVGRPIDGYLEPLCLLPERVARALQRVQVSARAEGYTLKMYDCYRPSRAGADFVRWRDSGDHSMRAEFYPALTKQQVFSHGYLAGGRSSHSSGSAVDLTLVRLPAAPQPPFVPGAPLVACTAPAGQRFPDNSIDMGTGYDCFDPRSHTLDARITGEPRSNRALLRRLMTAGGFINYWREWWHYDFADPPYRGRYFDFPVAAAALSR